MGELIVRFIDDGRERWGILRGDAPALPDALVSIAPIAPAARTTSDIVEAFDLDALDPGDVVEMPADRLVGPITKDATIFAQGLNYQAHAEEAQQGKRSSNLIFSKASSSLTGPFSPIVRPQEVALLDYEVEFGIVARRDLGAGDSVSPATIGDAVAGIVLANDVSARDTMFGASFLQWFRGKSYRTFCPVGPVLWLLKPDEVAEALASIKIELWVNGEPRQAATAGQLIWKPAETLTYLASSMDLKRGDLLLTGTPGGVTAPATLQMVDILKDHLLADDKRRDALRIEMTKGRPFLQPGDVVTALMTDIRGRSLGGMSNRVVEGA